MREKMCRIVKMDFMVLMHFGDYYTFTSIDFAFQIYRVYRIELY